MYRIDYNYMLTFCLLLCRCLHVSPYKLNTDTNRVVKLFTDIQFEMIGVTVSNDILFASAFRTHGNLFSGEFTFPSSCELK